MKKYKCDILNLEWGNDRDINIVEPILNYLEIEGLNVVREKIFNYEDNILKNKPKLLLLSNGVGDKMNHEAVKFAKTLGVRVVTLTSEGNYLDTAEAADQFLWGWNTEKKIIEDLHIEWSTSNLEIIQKYCTVDLNKIAISGGTGFDRYKILSFQSKEEFLIERNLEKFQNIIGYAAWGFDLFDPTGIYYERYRDILDKRYTKKELEILMEARKKIEGILINLIEANPDILFILKLHPSSVQDELTEIGNIGKYPNVIKIRGEEMAIADAINICDIWMAFESTTCLEAWLMNKTTLVIDAAESGLRRSEIVGGSPRLNSETEIQTFIDEFFEKNKSDKFDRLESEREDIIHKIIEHSDGLNHVRAAKLIQRVFIQNSKRELKYIGVWLKRTCLNCFRKASYFTVLDKIPIIRRYHRYLKKLEGMYDYEERKIISMRYKSAQIKFYNENQINLKKLVDEFK